MNEFVAAPAALEAGRFDPDSAERSWTLPARWYRDPLIYARERERIFRRSWIYQGHAGDLPAAGDGLDGQVDGTPVRVERTTGGKLVASAPAEGRRPPRVELLAGFVFVNLDPKAAPLATQIGGFADDIYRCCPRVDELVRVARIERAIAANWKTVVDNNHECYHCAHNHPALMQLVDYEHRAVWRDDGITFSHRVARKRLDNPAYRLDAGSLRQDSLFGYVWPTLVPLWFPGSPGAVLFQILPTGPETCIARHDFYFLAAQPSAQERDFMRYIDRELVPEDIALCEAVQRGLHSRGYTQGKLVVDRERPDFSEHHVHFFQSLVYHALTESRPARGG